MFQHLLAVDDIISLRLTRQRSVHVFDRDGHALARCIVAVESARVMKGKVLNIENGPLHQDVGVASPPRRIHGRQPAAELQDTLSRPAGATGQTCSTFHRNTRILESEVKRMKKVGGVLPVGEVTRAVIPVDLRQPGPILALLSIDGTQEEKVTKIDFHATKDL